MSMIWLKSCPRCGGDVLYESDVYGSYIKCAQCAFLRDVSGEVPRAAQRLGAWFLDDRVGVDPCKAGQKERLNHVEV